MGRRKIDLTGQRFGRLVVVGDTGKRKIGAGVVWKCKCDCGKEVEVSRGDLKNENTKSCGCLRIDNSKQTIFNTPNHHEQNNLVGRKFGRLTVIKKVREQNDRSYKKWLCTCECGNETIVITANLKSGTTLSCGCLHKEKLYSLETREKTSKTMREKYWVEKTSLPAISPSRKKAKGKTSNVIGVSWDKSKNKWLAQMKLANEYFYLGRYENIEDAINARKSAEDKYFKPMLDKYKV